MMAPARSFLEKLDALAAGIAADDRAYAERVEHSRAFDVVGYFRSRCEQRMLLLAAAY